MEYLSVIAWALVEHKYRDDYDMDDQHLIETSVEPLLLEGDAAYPELPGGLFDWKVPHLNRPGEERDKGAVVAYLKKQQGASATAAR